MRDSAEELSPKGCPPKTLTPNAAVDKAKPSERTSAHTKFQEIAFAYAILSDARRRARYDATGRTEESLEDDDDGPFDWATFYRAQYADVVTGASIAAFSADYKGGEEERQALLDAYSRAEGNMDMVYEEVMLSDPLEDDERFRKILDAAIEKGEVVGFDKYTRESEKSKKRRIENAKRDGKEAREWAKELGLEEKIFGNGERKSKKDANGEAGLAALIQQRQKARAGNFIADLEAKYVPKKKAKDARGGKKRAAEEQEPEAEPPEEAFEKNAAIQKEAKKAKPAKKGVKDRANVSEPKDEVRRSKRAKK